eukprot:Gb_38919 [translate_table: standard]
MVAIHTKVSQRWKKDSFNSFPIRIGSFVVTNISQEKSHAKEILSYNFEQDGVRKYDPDGIFARHYKIQSHHVSEPGNKYHNLVDYDWVAHNHRGSKTPPSNPKDSPPSKSNEEDKKQDDTRLPLDSEENRAHGDAKREATRTLVNYERRGEASRNGRLE